MKCSQLCGVCLLPWLVACAGTVVVDYEIEAKVQAFDEIGLPVKLPGQEIGVRPRPPNLASPFDWVRYRDETLDWTITVSSVSFGGDVRNAGSDALCLRFDQATIASSLRESEIPLKAANWLQYSPKHERIVAPPGAEKYFTPPSLCMQPSQSAVFTLTPELDALFPTRKMFNVSWPEGTPQLTGNGAGNWVRLTLPTERGTRKVVMQFQLIAIDSKARISHH